MRHELTASVMTQMDRLLEHLPKNDELARLDHDTLEIKTDARGNLMVRTAGAVYKIQHDVVWRYQAQDGGSNVTVTAYEDGKKLGEADVPVGATGTPTPGWN